MSIQNFLKIPKIILKKSCDEPKGAKNQESFKNTKILLPSTLWQRDLSTLGCSKIDGAGPPSLNGTWDFYIFADCVPLMLGDVPGSVVAR